MSDPGRTARLGRCFRPWPGIGRGVGVRLALAWAIGWPLALAFPADAAHAEARLSAILDAEWAFGVGDADSQKVEFELSPRLELDLWKGWQLDARARLRADGIDDLEPGEPTQKAVSRASKRQWMGKHAEIELRELFAAGAVGPLWLSVGKQQIVWGEADGLKVLDIVNPQVWREFILDEFEDSRIPLWALSAELPVGPTDLQLVYVPDPSFHDFPKEDALYFLDAPRFLPAFLPDTLPVFQGTQRPRDFGADGDAGLRWSAHLAGVDLTLNYLYHYDDRPIFFADRSAEPTVVYTPKYRRTHTLGGTYSTAIGDLTLRGEIGWQSDRFLSTTDAGDPNLVVRVPEIRYVLGFDWFGFEDTLLSLQVFQSWLLQKPPGLLRDAFETRITLLARRELLNQRLRLEVIWLHTLKDSDGLIRPKISFELRDGLNLHFGFDVFYGTARGAFGQFSNRDRMVLGFEWGF